MTQQWKENLLPRGPCDVGRGTLLQYVRIDVGTDGVREEVEVRE